MEWWQNGPADHYRLSHYEIQQQIQPIFERAHTEEVDLPDIFLELEGERRTLAIQLWSYALGVYGSYKYRVFADEFLTSYLSNQVAIFIDLTYSSPWSQNPLRAYERQVEVINEEAQSWARSAPPLPPEPEPHQEVETDRKSTRLNSSH